LQGKVCNSIIFDDHFFAFLYVFPIFGYALYEVIRMEKQKSRGSFSSSKAKPRLFSCPGKKKRMGRTQRENN